MTNNDDPAVTIEGERIVLAPSRMEIGKLYPFTWRGKNAVVRVRQAASSSSKTTERSHRWIQRTSSGSKHWSNVGAVAARGAH
jgi:hypothetical protein